jgi:hypothetical protein
VHGGPVAPWQYFRHVSPRAPWKRFRASSPVRVSRLRPNTQFTTIGINDPAFAHKLSIHNLWVFFYSVLTQIISGYQDRMNNIPGFVSGE